MKNEPSFEKIKKEKERDQPRKPPALDSAYFRLSSSGPSTLPTHWSYGDDNDENEPDEGFQVWTSLSRVAKNVISGDDDGDYTIEDGYEHLMIVLPKNKKAVRSFAGGNFWSAIDPENVSSVHTVDAHEFVDWLKANSEAWNEESGEFRGLSKWISQNEDIVYAWIWDNSREVKPNFESSF